jgi:hypothetical protein
MDTGFAISRKNHRDSITVYAKGNIEDSYLLKNLSGIESYDHYRAVWDLASIENEWMVLVIENESCNAIFHQ